MYSYGYIHIPKQDLRNLLERVGPGTFSTFEILKVYQGSVKRNEGISVEKSWNAHFGAILKQCEKDTNGTIIKEIEKSKQIIIDGGQTSTSIWKIY